MAVSTLTHLIDLNQVTKAYQTDAGTFLAWKGIDLHIDDGEFVAIVGKSGSGKTTLINKVMTGMITGTIMGIEKSPAMTIINMSIFIAINIMAIGIRGIHGNTTK